MAFKRSAVPIPLISTKETCFYKASLFFQKGRRSCIRLPLVNIFYVYGFWNCVSLRLQSSS